MLCDPALRRRLQIAIGRLYEIPPGSEIENVEHPIAYAYTALLRWDRGDAAGSDLAIDRLPSDVTDSVGARPSPGASQLPRLLSLIFRAGLSYGGQSCPAPVAEGADTWCGIFDAHPAEALQAFASHGGSVVDGYSGAQKTYCAQRLIRDFGSPKLASDFASAVSRLDLAIEQVAARPSGSAYSTIHVQIDDLVAQPIFGVSHGLRSNPQKRRAAIQDARKFIRDLDARLASFRQMEEVTASDLGRVYCAMAKHRGRPSAAEACRNDAEARLEEGLEIWLAASPYASLHVADGGALHEPQPLK
ncbi:MAG TPA: hypothetical protein VHE30_09560 [Polyangiaceae bacterium]|nr:hypothetical protein [Polyangiaceae bacterium]